MTFNLAARVVPRCLRAASQLHRSPSCLLANHAALARPSTVFRPSTPPPSSAKGFASVVVQRPKEFIHSGNVRDNNGARRKRKILGRGEGGKGKTSGRGQKGYKARQHKSRPTPGFEGGQSGIIKAIPHMGLRGLDKPRFTRLYLDTLQHFIDSGKLDASKKITIADLVQAKAVGKIKDGIVLLGKVRDISPPVLRTGNGTFRTDGSDLSMFRQGGEFFDKKVDIEVTRVTQPAVQLIEKLGGTVTSVYHGKVALKAILRPDKWAIMPVNPMPTRSADLARYTDEAHRGYLAQEAEGIDKRQLVKTLLQKSRARVPVA
ncbi:YmL15 [Thoreauomyces humboldtii]|nr:YmL15 [Thoreauomyces humboldtii]